MTTVGHTTAYRQLDRSVYSRTVVTADRHHCGAVASNFERLANHTGDLALAGDAGFLPTVFLLWPPWGDSLNMTGRSGNRSGAGSFVQPAWRSIAKTHEVGTSSDWTPRETSRMRSGFFGHRPGDVTVRRCWAGNQKEIGLLGLRGSGCGRVDFYGTCVRITRRAGPETFTPATIRPATSFRAQVRWLETKWSLDFVRERLTDSRSARCRARDTGARCAWCITFAVAPVEGWRGEILPRRGATDDGSISLRTRLSTRPSQLDGLSNGVS